MTIRYLRQPPAVQNLASGSNVTSTVLGTTLSITNTRASTSTTTGALKVSGGVGIQGNLYANNIVASNLTGTLQTSAQPYITQVGVQNALTAVDLTVTGNLVLAGNLSTVNARNSTVNDSLISLHTNGNILVVDDGRDIGIAFNYYKSAVGAQTAYLVWDNSSERLTYYSQGTVSPGGVVSGSLGTFETGNLVISSNTNSIDTTTGALVVAGGIGVAGNARVQSLFTDSIFYANGSPYGAVGATGAQGPTGASGAIGYTGSVGNDGIIGPRGYTGSLGPAGGFGPVGYTGSAGAAGTAGTVGSTGATGSAGATGIGSPGYTGSRGFQGVAGINGVDGATGATGPKGVQGDPGPSGATGLTGAAGIPGADGSTGATGPTGLTGDPGPQGATGLRGFSGTDGLDGATGATGAPGPEGQRGYTGSRGLQGTAGTAGADGATGATGLRGIQGDPGPQGATGLRGPAGLNGVDGATGSTGAPGPEGQRGYAGSRGAQGVAGVNGLDGATGATGVPGQEGQRGYTGSRGLQGVDGVAGADGATGATGPRGIQGDPGPAGATGLRGPSGLNGSDGATGATGPRGTAGLAGATGATGAGATGATGPKGDAGDPGGATGATGLRGPSGLQGMDGEPGATGPRGLTGDRGPIGFTGSFGYTGSVGATGTIQNVVYHTVNFANTDPSYSSTTGAFIVGGGVGIAGNLNVSGAENSITGNVKIFGNLMVQGNTVTVTSTQVTYDDSILDLHTDPSKDPLIVDDSRDIGIRAHYFKGGDRHAFFGWVNDTGEFTYYQDGQEANGKFVGDYGDIRGRKLISSEFQGFPPLQVDSTTEVHNLNAQFANLVTNSAQPNITSVGTLTHLEVAGNLTTNSFRSNVYYDGSGNQLQTLRVDLASLSGNISNVITNVSTLRFDEDSGFDVNDLGNGIARIGMNSTFKYWEVEGQAPIVAYGLDTIKFIAGTGIVLETQPNAVPKSLKITADPYMNIDGGTAGAIFGGMVKNIDGGGAVLIL